MEISRQSENIQAQLKIGKNERQSTITWALKSETWNMKNMKQCMFFYDQNWSVFTVCSLNR